MYLYEQLIQQAYDNGINVIETTFKSNLKGAICNSTIVINKNLTTKEKTSVLVHELGHYNSSCYSEINTKNVQVRKSEITSNYWAINNLDMDYLIQKAISNGHETSFEISEEIGISEDYLLECMSLIKQKNS